MNSNFSTLCLLGLTLIVPTLSTVAGNDLIVNGSFEDVPTGQAVAPHWFVHKDVLAAVKQPQITLHQKSSDAFIGGSYLQLSKTGGGPLPATQVIAPAFYPELMVNPDRQLVLKAKIRGEGLDARGARISLQVFSQKPGDDKRTFAGRLVSRAVTGNTEWIDVEIPFRLGDILPVGTTLAYLEVNAEVRSDSGHADFDQFTLTTVGE